ncbi:MAG TPA: histidine kinase [Vicinamibacterales bacterium]|nr:histidine kinase [Vicinamibacterales bacterium]
MGAPRARRQFAGIILVSAAAVLLFFGSFGRGGWPTLLYDAGTAVLFSTIIGGALQLLLPRVAPIILDRTRAPVNWLLLVGVMMTVATAGSAVAIGILIGIGALQGSMFSVYFANALRISVAITLTFGVGVTLYERLRHRADAAELALRTKERDEADAQRLATEAQLASLESRVQPHFLFNTLNSIAALIPQDPAGAEKMTGQLASLLRSALDSADGPLVPLGREVATVRDYLEIERVRFGERLRYALSVPAALEPTLVPRLALQTLVENSVKYAITPRREGGTVRVSADVVAATVVVVVEDDGPGFDPSMAPDHHGLALVRDRLRLAFGDRASLEVRSLPGQTSVVLKVPR